MLIQNLPVTDLIDYANNARTHSNEQVGQIASSIRAFGFNNPILIDENKTIIAGHGRLMGAKKLGLEEVPTIQLSHLSEAQKKAYILADNRIAENSDWNDELLSLELEGLQEMDFDIDLTGFDNDFILTEKKVIDEQDPEIEFTEELNETHNYMVLYFDNEIDWLNITSLFGMKTVKALDSKKGFEKQGVGRVVKGADFLEKLNLMQ